jgi:hypothetical protein
MTRTPSPTVAAIVVGALTLAGRIGPAAAQPAPEADKPAADKPADKGGTSVADRRQANALFKEGVRLFNAKQFADALDLFENAYHRYPDARILYSMASTFKQLGKTVAAANAFQRYIDDPGAEPQFVAASQTELHVIDATVGVVEVSFEGDPGELQLDDGQWAPAGTKRFRVEPGSFIVHGRRPGFTGEVVGRASPGAATAVTIRWTAVTEVKQPDVKPGQGDVKPGDVKPGDAKPGDAKPLPTPAAPAQGSPMLAYGLAGGGAVLGLVAVFLEVSSRGKISDAESICGAALKCGEPQYSQATADLDAAATRRNGAILFGALAVGAIGTGVYLYLQHGKGAEHHDQSALRIVPVAPIGDGHAVGVLVGGGF